MSAVLHRTINGKPYTFRRVPQGWAVCSAESQTDRFYRAYLVLCKPDGEPYSCSCPSARFASQAKLNKCEREGTPLCKHIGEVRNLMDESWKALETEEVQDAKEG